MVVVAFKIFFDHLAANKDKHGKGYPVVDSLQILAEISRAKPTDKRHDGLEQSEEETHAENGETQGAAH